MNVTRRELDIRQGDALEVLDPSGRLDAKAFRAAMAAYDEACPGDVSGKRRTEAAIRAYLRSVRARSVPGQLGLGL